MVIIDSVEKWNNTFTDGEIYSGKYILGANLVFTSQPNIPRLTGIFNGKDYSLTINYNNHLGFFRLDGGIICSVIIKLGSNGSINSYQGGLTNTIQWDGDLDKTPIETITKCSQIKKCKFIANIVSNFNGGLMGSAFLTSYKNLQILNCEMKGNISGSGFGGLCAPGCGSFGEIKVLNCKFTGNITGIESGGILGGNSAFSGKAIIRDCKAIGNIDGGVNEGGIGGILGPFSGVSGNILVENCCFKGTIKGTNNAGIIGEFTCNGGGNIRVINCYASGTITSNIDNNRGTCSGIVGPYVAGTGGNAIVERCIFNGEISGYQNTGVVGGFGGASGNMYITDCHCEGKVSADKDYEVNNTGVVGIGVFSAFIKNCSFKGQVSGNFTSGVIGVLVGQDNGKVSIINCSMEGDVFSDNPDQVSFGNAAGVVGSAVGFNGGFVYVEGCSFKGKLGGFNTAGVVGSNAGLGINPAQNGNVEIVDCNCNAKIDGTNIGGICGLSPSLNDGITKIRNCSYEGVIKGVNCGGIVANQSLNQDIKGGKTFISGCKSKACIIGKNSGGIIGSNSVAAIVNCEVSGCISGEGSGSICGADSNVVVGETSQSCSVTDCKILSKVCGNKVGGIFGSNSNNPSAQNVCLLGIYRNNNGAVIQSGKATLLGEVKAGNKSQAAGSGEVVNADIFFKN